MRVLRNEIKKILLDIYIGIDGYERVCIPEDLCVGITDRIIEEVKKLISKEQTKLVKKGKGGSK